MRQIRNGVFETNSSSTHAICICRDSVSATSLAKVKVYFKPGEFGWEKDTLISPEEKASYLWTAILCLREDEAYKIRDNIEAILEKNNISSIFIFSEKSTYYIDHCYLDGFIDKVLESEESLLSYLFNDSTIIYTGNDEDDNYVLFYDVANAYCEKFNCELIKKDN